MLSSRWKAAACATLLTLALAGACEGPAARRRQLASLNPLDRVRATVALAEAGDMQAVHRLVDLLEDADAAVRLYAIMGLQRLCGTTLGYEYFAPEAERVAAMQRWREALRRGQVFPAVRERRAAARQPAQTVTSRPAIASP